MKKRLCKIKKSILVINNSKKVYSTTLLGDNFGIDYAKYRSDKRRRDFEEQNEKAVADLYHKINKESARKDFMYNTFINRNTNGGLNFEDYRSRQIKMQQDLKNDLMKQLKDREMAKFIEKTEKRQNDLRNAELFRENQKKAIEEEHVKKLDRINEMKNALDTDIKYNEKKKKQDQEWKDKDKEMVLETQRKYQDISDLCTTERINQRKKLAETLQNQINNGMYAKIKEREKDMQGCQRSMPFVPSDAVYIKKYSCDDCYRKYPKNHLSKLTPNQC